MFSAPVDVQFSEFDVVQPDLVVVLNENVRKITPTKIKVAPNLVVEILSPPTSDYDRTHKKNLYEKFGVQEYWLVDAFEQSVEQWVLADCKLELAPVADPLVLSIAPEARIAKDSIW